MASLASPPVALTIAGSDNSAGAGAQADLKTFAAFDVYGLSAITCIVAEVPGRVSLIQSAETRIVAEQIQLSFKHFPVAAVKTGMLYSAEIIACVADELQKIFGEQLRPPMLVVDPVMVATSGESLLQPDAVELYKTRLFKLAALITPNMAEAQALLGKAVTNLAEMRPAVEELAEMSGAAVVLKGGHLEADVATDLLWLDGQLHEFSAPFVHDVEMHGTGCSFSAAIAANLAIGLTLEHAVAEAKKFISNAISNHFHWEAGENRVAALNHFAEPAES